MSGTNLNLGIYDNDLKGVGQDARSHLRLFSVMNGLSSACPFQFQPHHKKYNQMGALFLAFGLAFEIPIAVVLLCKMGITDVDTLSRSRSYVIVASFVMSMLLTPPDIISQTLLAIPMCLLFELGLMVSRMVVRESPEQQEEVL